MHDDQSSCSEELISSEQLNTFSIVEIFCDQCGDLTPHHLDDEKEKTQKLSSDKTMEAPISLSACVYCRESEEAEIEGL
jgi:uncharacterized protein YcgI (DUF1989 family)